MKIFKEIDFEKKDCISFNAFWFSCANTFTNLTFIWNYSNLKKPLINK